MAKFFLIRHGEPDWSLIEKHGLISRDCDFVTLTDAGARQIEEKASDPRLQSADALISSPYPRTLQSAHILCCRLKLPLIPERGLHEWWPYKDPTRPCSSVAMSELWGRLVAMKGNYPPPDKREWDWESPAEIRERALAALEKYLHHKRVIVVTHAGVIYALTGETDVCYADIVEFTMNGAAR